MYDPTSHAQKWPDKPAMIIAETGEQITYGELDERSKRLAQLFWSEGLRPGDHVAVLMENHLRYAEVYWAAIRSGLYLTAVNRHLTAGEAGYILDDCQAQVLVTSAYLTALAEQVVPLTPRIRRRLMVDGVGDHHEDYEAAIAAHPAEALAEEPLGRTMLYSSGSTGRPKGVWRPLSGRDVSEGKPALLPIYVDIYHFDSDTVYLSPAPMYHSAPLLFTQDTIALGGTVVVMRKFDAEASLAAIERYRVTKAQFVATMFSRMLKLPEAARTKYDLSSLEMVIHGAAPCPVHVKRAMIEWLGPIIIEYYAGTEDSGATIVTSEDWLTHPGTVGRAIAGCTTHICDETGRELPPGEVGRIYFEGSEAAADFHYFGEPDKTLKAHHPEHPTWSALGDLGRLDEEGFLYLADREAFMIIAGGVNIYPQEIEDVLSLHPAVADSAVFGVPDEDLGEQVKAVVQPAQGHVGSPELARELLDHCAQHLARFKVPRSIDFLGDFPRSPTGKLKKASLRDSYWADRDSRLV